MGFYDFSFWIGKEKLGDKEDFRVFGKFSCCFRVDVVGISFKV